MWRATVLAAGLAFALAGGADQAMAQGNGKGKGSDRFERKDDKREESGRSARGVSGRGVTQDTRRGDDPWYGRRPDSRDDRRWDDRDTDRDSDRRYNDRYDERYGRSNGPAFCRSGAGHPVHGRQWCRDKGYRLGNDRWDRAGWDDVIFGRRDGRYENTRMGGSVLEGVLGRVIFGRLTNQARYVGGGPLYGSWVATSGGPRILQVYAGSRPLAEFVDRNRDGRAELVLLNYGR